MSEAEKQEGQKTVVAFITGLLIGGLLVWVFSSSPDAQPAVSDTPSDSATEQTDDTARETTDQTAAIASATKPVESTKPAPVNGNGTLTVSDQKAGDRVTLGAASYPTDNGWVVVRDYENNTAGNILGAARYNKAEGLAPTSVGLLRATKAGSSYQVVFYTDNGDKKFSLTEDAPVLGGEKVFKAN